MERAAYLKARSDFSKQPAESMMITEVVSVRPEVTCREAAIKLSEGGFGSLPVVDAKNKLIGLISEFDILDNLFKEKLTADIPVSEIMVHEVKTVQTDTPVDSVRRILQMEHLIRVPVVRDGQLVGIIARRDIIKGYLKATSGPGG